jgi:alkanesulfonate monooxygenase SsuD/methylene tetrahydromethanopterin reductase-like flavin-dependent oxidoreductase (luciferase family)
MSSGLGSALAQNLANRQAYVDALIASGHDQTAIDALLSRWVVTKHVYVAPTDAEAEADVEGPEMWYRDAFVRSLSTDGLQGLHPSVYEQAHQAQDRLRAQTWQFLRDEALIIGSPETVARKVAELDRVGVGELACWMNFGGIPPDKARRSMRLFAEEVMPAFRGARV